MEENGLFTVIDMLGLTIRALQKQVAMLLAANAQKDERIAELTRAAAPEPAAPND
jgi:hypothetical protein